MKEDKFIVKNLEFEIWYFFNVRVVGLDDSIFIKFLKLLFYRIKKVLVVIISKLDIICVVNLLVIFYDDIGLRIMK